MRYLGAQVGPPRVCEKTPARGVPPQQLPPQAPRVGVRPNVVAVVVATLLASRVVTAQTLDELQGPLLPPGQVVVAVDHTSFALGRITVEFGRPPVTSVDPPFYTLTPSITIGLSKRAQVTVDGAYLIPTTRSYQIFDDPDSQRDESWGVISLRTQVRVRPSARMAIDTTYLRGRERFRFSSPRGLNPSADRAADAHILETKGLWLSQPDENRPRRADLDGLSGPLLRKRRTKVDWEGMWRRYDSTNASKEALLPPASEEARSTDLRLRLGVGYGVLEQLEVSGDGYWQPAFAVAESSRRQADPTATDYSRRVFDVFGARAAVRWRPTALLQAFGETTVERQAVTFRPESLGGFAERYRQRRLTAGLSFLSRSPRLGTDLRADLNGLYRPLLERNQLRLDALLHLRRSGSANAERFEEATWRVQGALGVSSFLQVGAYAGRFRYSRASGPTLFPGGTSVGGTARLRLGRRVEGYASFDYYPTTFVDDYPAFNLPRGSRLFSFYDFTRNTFEDDASSHVGVRLLF